MKAAPAGSWGWWTAGALLLVLGGAALLVWHARRLGESSVSTAGAAAQQQAANIYQTVLPGARFNVPSVAGIFIELQANGALLMVSGLRAGPAQRVDLCHQMRDAQSGRLLPLRIGYRFADVARWVGRGRDDGVPLALRNVLLVSDEASDAMPEVQLSGTARADFADPLGEPLKLSWRARQGAARWLSDASLGQPAEGVSGEVGLRQQGWLVWGAQALRVERRVSGACPQAGELVVQLFRAADGADSGAAAPAAAKALVVAFPARGKAVSAWLPAGDYAIPGTARPALEDETLFDALLARGLVRLDADGGIDAVPRDLALWRAAPDSARAADLARWRQVQLDEEGRSLLKRLYRQADGVYVRQQIDIFNSERRLLAWRVPDEGAADGGPEWRASAGGSPLPAGEAMPPLVARLFADLPQGWAPWSRVLQWPAALVRQPLRLTLDLPSPAGGGERLRLMLLGRASAASGAALRADPACNGRACSRPDDAQILTLTLQAGARSVALDVQPLLPATSVDQQYRHLRVSGGRMVWQRLPDPVRVAAGKAAPAAAVGANPGAAAFNKGQGAAIAAVRLQDRNGTLLWADGASTSAARDAGLATMLGLAPGHASSIAGMLARLPQGGEARLTLDLPLQALSQRILDCAGMRHGRWDGAACSATRETPAGRRAGLVILDAENGDILAAAGAGTGEANGANWAEIRDFDRANPARSPLRLPALQHDGGAHQSPGSTFKVVTALGLEMAARKDAQMDAMLGGLSLAALNGVARQRGFAFETSAASYPAAAASAHQARVTNYREQGLDRRAQEGKLGLAQAMTYSLNTWFAWSAELSDRSLFGRAEGGAPDLQALEPGALDGVRPIVAAARLLGFEQPLRLDGGLLPPDFNWQAYDALQSTPAHMDPIHTRHELRQMAIGLRMQATPLQMALASAAVGQGRVVVPRLLLQLDGKEARNEAGARLEMRLDRIRAGMKGVVERGTAASAFGGAALAALKPGLYGKTGTAPVTDQEGTVWFTGWLEPGSLPKQQRRLAFAVFISHSPGSGGEHAAPVLAAILASLANQNVEKRGK
ncbi:penicillin-binding transpeptidase domain-containing protein [Pseudoduganella violacea]|uniref:beta-lactamase n=1 Tax=Pseudoduganella violacea TaxID=1715466 RepID=A0A7W5FVM1_9BURK|nr:penicillin-binding transpeptidase domain-containing protein [Pseudoduganella violacea]MBB3121145.1 cell division protein FtsI/penicillin-binding protein 2 [Pseudoduganella violacea]